MTDTNRFSFVSPLLWLAAFVCALYPINEYQLGFMGASLLLLFVWSYDRLSKALKEGVSLPRTYALVAIAGLWLLALVSVLLSDIPWIAAMAFFMITALPLTFLTLAIKPYSETEWRWVMTGVGIIMAVLAGWAVIQFLFFAEYFAGRAVHPLRDPNSLAALLNLGLLGGIGWMSLATERRVKLAAFLFSVLLMAALIATGSRGGFFALIIGLMAMVIFCRSSIVVNKRWWIGIIGAVILLLSVTPYLAQDDQTTTERVATTLGLHNSAVPGDRLDTMKATWHIARDHWLTGTGIGTMYLYYPEYRPIQQADYVTHAHNDPLQFWVEMGIGGPLLFYAFIGLAVWATRKQIASGVLDDARRQKVLFAFITLGVLVAHSHINFNFYNLSILCLAGLIMAYWLDQLSLPRVLVTKGYSRSWQAVVAGVFALAMLAQGALIASSIYTNKAREALMRGDIAQYGEDMMMADTTGLQQNPDVYMTAVNAPMTLLYQRRDMLDDEEMRKEVEQINNNLNRALTLNPRLAPAWYFKGLLAQVAKLDVLPADVPSSDEAFRKALALDPTHIGARVGLIDLALVKDDYEAAARWVRPALDILLFTQAANDLYSRAVLVFSALGDKEGLEKTSAAKSAFDDRVERSRWLDENKPWARKPAGTFPQPPESASE